MFLLILLSLIISTFHCASVGYRNPVRQGSGYWTPTITTRVKNQVVRPQSTVVVIRSPQEKTIAIVETEPINAQTVNFVVKAIVVIIFLIAVVLILFFIIQSFNKTSTRRSSDFMITYRYLTDDEQIAYDAFKQGPHSWQFDSTYTGVIIADVVLTNNEIYGSRLVFDVNQVIMFLSYFEVTNLYQAALVTSELVTLRVPGRVVQGQNIFDSTLIYYEIVFNPYSNLFKILSKSGDMVPNITYFANGSETTKPANARYVW